MSDEKLKGCPIAGCGGEAKEWATQYHVRRASCTNEACVLFGKPGIPLSAWQAIPRPSEAVPDVVCDECLSPLQYEDHDRVRVAPCARCRESAAPGMGAPGEVWVELSKGSSIYQVTTKDTKARGEIVCTGPHPVIGVPSKGECEDCDGQGDEMREELIEVGKELAKAGFHEGDSDLGVRLLLQRAETAELDRDKAVSAGAELARQLGRWQDKTATALAGEANGYLVDTVQERDALAERVREMEDQVRDGTGEADALYAKLVHLRKWIQMDCADCPRGEPIAPAPRAEALRRARELARSFCPLDAIENLLDWAEAHERDS